MLNKIIKKFRNYTLDFSRDFNHYEPKFEANDWKVIRRSETFSDTCLKIYFKDHEIARAVRGENLDIVGLNIVKGFEELAPELIQVLIAVSRKRIEKEKQILIEKQNLVKQAKAETKFLGPF